MNGRFLILVALTATVPLAASAQSTTDASAPPSDRPSGTAGAQDARWYHDAERGWFWYEDPPKAVEPEDAGRVVPPVAATPADPLAELAALQAEIERSKALAVLHPNEENVLRWMELNAEVQRRATLFADVTQRVVWSTPALDQSLVRPHSQEGLRAWTAARTESNAKALREIAHTYGLFFVFDSDCPYCIQIAPFISRFAQTYKFKVIPISLDGGALAEYPNARYEPTMKATLGVEATPAIFLVNPAKGDIQPVAYGVISISELENRIIRLLHMEPGQMTYSVYQRGDDQ